MSQTTVGQRHRDHITPNSSFRVESNSALECYFFGKNGKEKLSASKFLEFQVGIDFGYNVRVVKGTCSRRVYTPISCEWSLKEGMQWTVSMA